MDQGLRSGTFSGKNFRVWSYEYSTGFDTVTPSDPNPNRFLKNTVSLEDDSMLWTYSGPTLFNLRHVYGKNGDGVYFAPTTVYLGLNDVNANPNNSKYFISRTKSVISISDSKSVIIDGKNKSLVLKHGANNGISLTDNENVSVRDVKVVNPLNGITLYSTAVDKNKNIQVIKNQLVRNFDPDWSWNSVKRCLNAYKSSPRWEENSGSSGCTFGSDGVEGGANSNTSRSGSGVMEGKGVRVSTDQGNSDVIIAGNDVNGYFDGIGFEISSSSAQGTIDDIKIHCNDIHNVYDDGIEMDHPAELTVVADVFDNMIYDSFLLGANR